MVVCIVRLGKQPAAVFWKKQKRDQTFVVWIECEGAVYHVMKAQDKV